MTKTHKKAVFGSSNNVVIFGQSFLMTRVTFYKKINEYIIYLPSTRSITFWMRSTVGGGIILDHLQV